MTRQEPTSAVSDDLGANEGEFCNNLRTRSWRIKTNLVLAAILGAMILIPPWVDIEMGGSQVRFVGYRFLFAPPEGHLVGIDNARMAAQLLAFAVLLLIANLAVVLIARKARFHPSRSSPRRPPHARDRSQLGQGGSTVRRDGVACRDD